MTRPIPPLDLATLMRDDVALAALCDDRPDLHDCLCSKAERRVQFPARRSTFSTLSTLLLWIVIAAGYGVLAAGWL